MRKAFVEKLTALAREDGDVTLLTGDLGFCLFEEFREAYPGQFLNVGLSEQCMIGMAAGLALEGKKVFVYSIIPFLAFRPFEQIRNDLCFQRLPVKLVGVGSGMLYGADGGTHHSIEDLGVLTSLPDMMVFAPGDPAEVEKIVESSLAFDAPCYIRLSRTGDPVVHSEDTIRRFRVGEPLRVRGSDPAVTMFAAGNVLPMAVEASEALDEKRIPNTLYSVHTLKPLERSRFADAVRGSACVLTIEEHVARNGLRAIVNDILVETECRAARLAFHLPDAYDHVTGTHGRLRARHGLTAENIVDQTVKCLRRQGGK